MVFNLFKKGNDVPEAKSEEASGDLTELLLMIVKRLVDNPDEVEIREIDGERSTILELKVNESDIGKVIGKKGRIIKSLRIVLRAAAVHDGKSVSIELAKEDE